MGFESFCVRGKCEEDVVVVVVVVVGVGKSVIDGKSDTLKGACKYVEFETSEDWINCYRKFVTVAAGQSWVDKVSPLD